MDSLHKGRERSRTPSPRRPAPSPLQTPAKSDIHYEPIHERKKPVKRRLSHRPSGVEVFEQDKSQDAGSEPKKPRGRNSAAEPEEEARRHTYRRLTSARNTRGNAATGAQALYLPAGFAEDYFASQGCRKLQPEAVERAALPSRDPNQDFSVGDSVEVRDGTNPWSKGIVTSLSPLEVKIESLEKPFTWDQCRKASSERVDTAMADLLSEDPSKVPPRFNEWLLKVKTGFSLLLYGAGSKRQVLTSFCNKALIPWGANIVTIDGFNTRFSLQECLRSIFEQWHSGAERLGGSAEALAASIRAARRTGDHQRLCLVVHSLEALAPAHQVILSNLAASRGVHLAASIDNMLAFLAWDSQTLGRFNFCHEEVHTFQSYEAETSMRYPTGLPAWTGVGTSQRQSSKASLGLVLRSLTLNHRELVEEIAKLQLENPTRSGLSMGQLLKVAQSNMIAANVTKLRSLLNELLDHEIVIQKVASDGSSLFQVSCDEKKLRRLAEGEPVDECSDADPPSEDAGASDSGAESGAEN